MATTYLSPGVYIEEVDKGTKPIQGVPTAIAAFAGFTEKAEELSEDGYTTQSILSKAKLITNWGQYQQHFGGLIADAYLPYAVRGFFDNGGSICHVISIRTFGEPHPAQALVNTAPTERNPIGTPSLLIHSKATGPDGKPINTRYMNVKISLANGHGTTTNDNDGSNSSNGGGGSTNGNGGSKPGQQPSPPSPTVETTAEAPAREGSDNTKSSSPSANEDDSTKPGRSRSNRQDPPPAAGGAPTSPADAGFQANTDQGPVLMFQVYLDEKQEQLIETVAVPFSRLPNVRGKDREKKNTHDRFQHLKVWVVAESGKLEERLPQPGTAELKEFAWQLDTEFLPDNAETQLLAGAKGTLDSLFTENSVKLFEGNTPSRKGIGALAAVANVNLVLAPDVMLAHQKGWITDDQLQSIQQAMLTHCQLMGYRFAILDAPHNKKTADAILEWRMNIAGYDSMHGALYYPWIKISDPVTNRSKFIPPSGYIAGIYARSDDQRGVHKAPANEVVMGAIDVETNVTKGEQDLLNPVGINCIRKFPGRGIRVWGARTLSSDPSWRYINVRRLFNYVEESIENNTQWIVFEPNDPILWAKVRRDITAFLRTVWLSGALFGLTPEQAFYVKCDDETNLRELRDLGQMVCEIGMAPVKPAEFVIFRFSQWAADAEV